MKKKKKYEFYIIQSNEQNINDLFQLYQNDGWEIAGEVVIKISDTIYRDKTIFIPIKREI